MSATGMLPELVLLSLSSLSGVVCVRGPPSRPRDSDTSSQDNATPSEILVVGVGIGLLGIMCSDSGDRATD
jgi:hypothetical protein